MAPFLLIKLTIFIMDKLLTAIEEKIENYLAELSTSPVKTILKTAIVILILSQIAKIVKKSLK